MTQKNNSVQPVVMVHVCSPTTLRRLREKERILGQLGLQTKTLSQKNSNKRWGHAAQLEQCLHSTQGRRINLVRRLKAYNHNTGEMKARRSGIPDHSWLHREFKAGLGYTRLSSQSMQASKQTNTDLQYHRRDKRPPEWLPRGNLRQVPLPTGPSLRPRKPDTIKILICERHRSLRLLHSIPADWLRRKLSH